MPTSTACKVQPGSHPPARKSERSAHGAREDARTAADIDDHSSKITSDYDLIGHGVNKRYVVDLMGALSHPGWEAQRLLDMAEKWAGKGLPP
jgi:hypothetical protein